MVLCPICGATVKQIHINSHIDSQCETHVEKTTSTSGTSQGQGTSTQSPSVSAFFQTPASKATVTSVRSDISDTSRSPSLVRNATRSGPASSSMVGSRRPREDDNNHSIFATNGQSNSEQPTNENNTTDPPMKRQKTSTSSSSNALSQVAPLADRMRPQTLDEICGQDLVGPHGVLRGLIEQDRVPSMILWGGPGTGKTTIARVIANVVNSRFIEINSTNSGVGECKKIFAEARNELSLTGRKTIFFCDEIHRFSKSQQDVFLGPVESGQITLIGATTENPSFKVQNALLSRCRTFVLSKLTDWDIFGILERALKHEAPRYPPSELINEELITYLARFSDGDARTGLNLLELALGLSTRPEMSQLELRKALTKTLVYDRAGDQHYDTISAFHKSIRGSDVDASLYYLARMLESGEDPLFIARRLIVIASEDIGLADNSMLSLATATYTATEKIGMPEARINLAHATFAMAESRKSTRVYRSLGNVLEALKEPGIAGLSIPFHLRNASTKLLKELGHGREYKYNPNYRDGKVKQDYLPPAIKDRKFFETRDLGTEIDPDLGSSTPSEEPPPKEEISPKSTPTPASKPGPKPNATPPDK
ncbi:MAG: hypothetical protein M1823_003437 [Watsoniomyces obsoletus]|nr:MAG: hypothetical protein M1823_003437 [Watsoniomyces obsoletus]